MREHRYQPFKDMLDKINYSDLNLELCLFFLYNGSKRRRLSSPNRAHSVRTAAVHNKNWQPIWISKCVVRVGRFTFSTDTETVRT